MNTTTTDTTPTTTNLPSSPSIPPFNKFQTFLNKTKGNNFVSSRPPFNAEFATPLILYDVFLLLNLSISIKLWLYHSVSLTPPFTGLTQAFASGSRLSVSWVTACLISNFYHPPNCFDTSNIIKRSMSASVTTASILLSFELIQSVFEATQAGDTYVAQEIAMGTVLMVIWRLAFSVQEDI
ncbi:hypothetical protein TrCOL_g7265 [Triparma columacea]|nr:hypothetical protein TrCOL_g7265 [Triparma columacea]